MKLSIAISPCPNDTFIFYGLICGKIKIPGVDFDFHFMDIEELNLGAINQQYDVCKISFALAPEIANNYDMLTAGSALGLGCGPILITPHPLPYQLLENNRIAVPGKHTTAFFLFNHFYPQHKNITQILFSTIEEQLQKNKFDAGVIIHESRFTFKEKELSQLVDFGELWTSKYNLPIPLGGIAISTIIGNELKSLVNLAIRQSIEYAYQNKTETLTFCSKYAQEMSPKVMLEHINLYVNQYSVNLGDDGKAAIVKLFDTKTNKNSCNFTTSIKFID
jgi:1,4-dihydroxy-6-naphthoate synthase